MVEQPKIGPPPSHVYTKRQFWTQQEIDILSNHPSLNNPKEDGLRLTFVNLMDNMRQYLRLPTKTFATGVMYYHTFRLTRAELEYAPQEAAYAALFVACKIEDTLKRSKEVVAAAKNYRLSAAEQIPWDSGHFDNQAKTTIGMERLVLETIGFDFRSRQPQELIVKLCKYLGLPKDTVYGTAFDASLDLYRTFAPLKMTSGIMAMACIELAAKIHNVEIPKNTSEMGTERSRKFAKPLQAFSDRTRVMETVQDLLDLYQHAQAPFTTRLGARYNKLEFTRVKLEFKNIIESEGLPRFSTRDTTNGSTIHSNGNADIMDIDTPASKNGSLTTSPANANGTTPKEQEETLRAQTGMKEGTLRYMVDIDRAQHEKEVVHEYYHDKTEEYEIEEEIEVHPPPPKQPRQDQNQSHSHTSTPNKRQYKGR